MAEMKTFPVTTNKGLTYQKFSEEDKQILLEQLTIYPDSRKEAFRQSSLLMPHRNVGSIVSYYYKHVLNSKYVIGTTGSSRGFTSNRKNTKTKDGQEFVRAKPLNPIMWLMKELLNLDEDDRLVIINFLNKTI
jgi:hypothetical protein